MQKTIRTKIRHYLAFNMSKLKIVKGNTFDTVVEIRAYKYNGEEITDFDLNNCTNLIINSKVSKEFYRVQDFQIIDANHIDIHWDGKKTKNGDYSLEVTGKYNGDDWRFYDKAAIFTIVNTNAEANIPKNSIIREHCYKVTKQSLYITGPKGEKGDKGDKGDVGPQGPKGDKGDKGDQGIQGEKGDKGDKGDPFVYTDFTPEQLAALKGDTGETGPQGETGQQGPQGEQGPTGEGFSIYRTYSSTALMEADADNVPEGKFVLITSNVEDPDNAKMYVKGASTFSFVTDMSGAQGIQGPQGPKGDPMETIYGNNNLRDWASEFIFAESTGQKVCLIPQAFTYNWTINSTNYNGSLQAGDVVAITEDNGSYTISVLYNMIGTNGQDGSDGSDGQDGVSPTIAVTSITGGHTISITDVNGTNSFNVMDGINGTDGTDGTNGNDGNDGITPTVTVTSISNGHNVAFSYGSGDSRNVNFNVMDGNAANQLQADWNQSDNTQADFIKNKPSEVTETTVANWGFTKNTGTSTFSGSYNDLTNKPSIPAAQIQADWNQTDNTALDYIKNKPNISGGGSSLSNETAAQGGTTLSAVTTGEKYTWNNKASIWSGTQAQYTALSPNYDSNTVYIITAS